MRTSPLAAAMLVAAAGATIAVIPSASAQMDRWGGRGWDGSSWGSPYNGSMLDGPVRPTRSRDPREGRVEVSRFIGEGDAASLLGHGAVEVSSRASNNTDRLPGDPVDSAISNYLPQNARAPFEAAVVDRLVALGYDTIHADPTGGQVAELRISREVLAPAEIKRSPVSGTAAMEVGNRGSAYGLAVNVDMTKPRTALLSTRLDARIRDRVSGKVLWEGRAEMASREDDSKWTDGMIANKLAEALFDDFRQPTGQGSPRG